ncbi:ABC transporter, ATP-binding domain protein [Staphylococcus aureus subsp. aureus CO-85]|nr:ABC transporter, ATP-binding domain protein [Staphylococcus aureus subsp. aureus CO-85]
MYQKWIKRQKTKVKYDLPTILIVMVKDCVKNIMFPLEIAGVPRRRAKQKALELVELVGLKGREKAYPSELSGGQKQRVGIARALANDPTVLLCDEATSALDPQTTDEILDLLLKIREQQNLTIVLITHEMHVIRRICDEVAVMESGKVIEQGPVTQVFENPQHTVTKRFVKDDLNDDFETSLTELEPLEKDAYIVRLVFAGSTTTEPIVSSLSTAYDIKINILEANIKNTKIGQSAF